MAETSCSNSAFPRAREISQLQTPEIRNTKMQLGKLPNTSQYRRPRLRTYFLLVVAGIDRRLRAPQTFRAARAPADARARTCWRVLARADLHDLPRSLVSPPSRPPFLAPGPRENVLHL